MRAKPLRWLILMLWLLCTTAHAQDLTLWHAYRGAERSTLENLLEEYSALDNGTKVIPRAIPYDGFNSKLEAAIPRGHGPDLFIAAHERLASWRSLGLVRQNPEPLTDVPESVEQALFHDDAHHGVPLAFKTLALFYNRDQLKEPPRTTEALLAFARSEKARPSSGGIPVAIPSCSAPRARVGCHGCIRSAIASRSRSSCSTCAASSG